MVIDDLRSTRRRPRPSTRSAPGGACPSRSSASTGRAGSWRKTAEAPAPATAVASAPAPSAPAWSGPPAPPLAPPAADGAGDLSVVVVFYNMKREAARTLHSLSRSYQHDIDDLDYEVVVVENGSDPDQRLAEEFVSSFGPEFRFIDLGDRGRAVAGVRPEPRHRRRPPGRSIALMIDGAHVLTPRVLHFGMAGLDALRAGHRHHPAVVRRSRPAARRHGRRLRPGVRGRALRQDRLAGQRLPAVRDRPLHRRPRLVRRRLGEQLRVRAPLAARAVGRLRRELLGGRRRLRQPRALRAPRLEPRASPRPPSSARARSTRCTAAPPRTCPTSTSAASASGPTPSTSPSCGAAGFRGPNKRTHYVGTMFPEAVRTRSRRKTAAEFFRKLDPNDPDGRPATAPSPSPRTCETGYLEAYWRNLGLEEDHLARAAGSPTPPATWSPTRRSSPRSGPTGSSTCAPATVAGPCSWPRSARSSATARCCRSTTASSRTCPSTRASPTCTPRPRARRPPAGSREITGADARALVVLGTASGKRRMVNEFDTYQSLVPVGSYVIIEETIVGGHPVWPSFGPGPVRGRPRDHPEQPRLRGRPARGSATASASTPAATSSAAPS